MSTYAQFAELRKNLGVISSQHMDLLTIQAIQTELWKLKFLREQWFYQKPAQLPALDQPSKTEQPKPFAKESLPEVIYSRPISLSIPTAQVNIPRNGIYARLDDLRKNLEVISSWRMGMSTLRALINELWKLKSLREYWLDPKPERVAILAPDTDVLEEIKLPKIVVPQLPEVPYKPRVSTSAPTSISHNTEHYLPYRILWAKVIIRATYDYALWKDSKDLRLRKFAQDAERWLFESSDLELSFENICFAFDFPVERIRQKTRTLTKHDVKKLEFRERQSRPAIPGDTLDGGSKGH